MMQSSVLRNAPCLIHELEQIRADFFAQRPMGNFIEVRRSVPVVTPWIRCAQRFELIHETRMHVRVQRRFHIAEHGVVDPQRARCAEYCLTEHSKLREELIARRRCKRIQMRHHRIRQQQAVASQHLLVAHDGPAGVHACNQSGMSPLAARLHQSMYGGAHAVVHLRNMKYTAPIMHNAAQR